MSWSLTEIETLSKKAARGAGLSWGLAEEAGKATRWLCSRGLPGTEILASQLKLIDGADYQQIRPQDTGSHWNAAGGTLCPVVAGTTICDCAAELAGGKQITLGPTSHPVLLVPFMAWAAEMAGSSLEITWSGSRVVCDGGKTLQQVSSDAALMAERVDCVNVGLAQDASGAPFEPCGRGEPSPQSTEVLTKMAHRTYAPDTPESRLAGAGAGLTDND